jgi:hypothetical protein
MKLECLRTVVASGGVSYPIYIGFCSPDILETIAVAPAFTNTTLNATIASNVLTPPVADWQRPLIDLSIAGISSTFDDTGRLMPNSVLLAKNPHSNQVAIPKQQTVNGSTPTSIWELEVNPPNAGMPKPLWILDGQHRINGMAASKQKSNQIPFVLLLNEDAASYAETRLAEIFAQVTTTAASLDPLHNEWMSYAFKLGSYADTASDAAAKRSAMESTALMCKLPQLDQAGLANPFRDRIKFNPKNPPSNFGGGFAYDCVDMQKLLYRGYFAATPATGVSRLSPEELAKQLGLAYLALQSCVKAPQAQTVFFGDRDHNQRIMQDAFFIGSCTRLLQNSLPINWKGLLQALKFNTSNWNFKPWIRSVGGTDQTVSKQLAEKVFRSYFKAGTVSGQGDLVDILKGDGAQFLVIAESLKPSGRVDKQLTEQKVLTKGANLGLTCSGGGRWRLRIPDDKTSTNIGSILAIDDGASTAANRVRLERIKSKGGLILDPNEIPQKYHNPLSLKFIVHLYGGIQFEADLAVTWA